MRKKLGLLMRERKGVNEGIERKRYEIKYHFTKWENRKLRL